MVAPGLAELMDQIESYEDWRVHSAFFATPPPPRETRRTGLDSLLGEWSGVALDLGEPGRLNFAAWLDLSASEVGVPPPSMSRPLSRRFELRDNMAAMIPKPINSRIGNFLDSRIGNFLDAIALLSREGQGDRAIDEIFRQFNDFQERGEFALCNDILREVTNHLGRIDPTLLVSFLVITLAAKAKLPARAEVYAIAERVFVERFGEWRARRLLMGLE
jgi:hypothetical protein